MKAYSDTKRLDFVLAYMDEHGTDAFSKKLSQSLHINDRICRAVVDEMLHKQEEIVRAKLNIEIKNLRQQRDDYSASLNRKLKELHELDADEIVITGNKVS